MKQSIVPSRSSSKTRWYDFLIDAELLLGGLAAITLVRWLTW